MNILINVKQLGKKKDVINAHPFSLQTIPATVKDLISEIVKTEVRKFNDKPDDNALLPYLTPGQIDDQASTGKIGFGVHHNDKKADERMAVTNALQAFEDGLFRAFLNETELTTLAQPIRLKETDQLTFIRLTMLAGRMW